ncbi:MAG: CpsD/CapB family tyrosine-protein kinase, partial [Sideroxyarcus sp.]|nr:CpsD/CapB family tyrosine-protein kinase [Sideroxyarcus sp.]
TLNAQLLAGNGLFTNSKNSPAAAAFDMLRTRILQALQQRGWKRVAVTSPTHGCGKSFVAANLALSLARMPENRTVLIDLELRNPGLADLLGVDHAGSIREFLSGDQPLESHFRRVGRNLALALNGEATTDAAELLHAESTAEALEMMLEQLDPDVAIYDMPPALGSDDVTMMLPQVDAVLLVADGTQTTADDIRACERLFEGRIPLMGVVLNRSQDRKLDRYRYGKK